MSDLENLLQRVSTTGRGKFACVLISVRYTNVFQGVSVQASTLGSLEALLEFLRVSKIPVANISIGPVFKVNIDSIHSSAQPANETARCNASRHNVRKG